MNGVVVGRIFWKEFRAQRAFWLGVLGISIGLELLATVLSGFPPFGICVAILFLLPCGFSVGSAAISFAGEAEAKTKGLLERIAARPSDVLVGKVLWGLVGSYSLMVALAISFGLMFWMIESARNQVPRAAELGWLPISLLAPLASLAVGSLFSLVLNEVLITVVAEGLCAVALIAVRLCGRISVGYAHWLSSR